MKNTMRKVVYLFFFLYISCVFAKADTGIFLSHINKSINSHIHRIYQDRTGHIWICTDNGLSKFNGTSVKTYSHIYGDSTSLMTNSVLTVLEDRKGNFWVGTTEGLQHFDRRTEKFKTIKFTYPYIKDFSYINCIIEDRSGNIWISTSRAGAICLKAETFQPTYYMPTNSNICSNKINSIFEDKYGSIWIGSHDKGVSVLNRENNVIVNYASDSSNPNSLSSNKIFTITDTPDGNILIGSIDSGIDLFDFSTRQIIRKYIPRGERVFTLMNDRKRELWIGTDGGGLKRYNYQTKKTTDFEPFSTGIDMRGTKIHSIIEDQKGNIWLALFQKGILMIPSHGQVFQTMGFNPFYSERNIGSECVLCMTVDKDGDCWMGTDGDGIYRLDKAKRIKQHYKNLGLKAKNVVAIFQDSQKRIWAGTYLSGLYRIMPGGNAFTPEEIVTNGQGITDINFITEDRQGNLWLGTNSDGVCIYNPDTKQVSWLKHDILKTEGQLLSNSIHGISIARNDKIWISTSSVGLSCYDPSSRSFTDYTVASVGLSNDCINTVAEDAKGNLWVGTKAGLNYIDTSTGKVEHIYTKADGLPDMSVNSLEIDKENNLWISTSMGLAFFDVNTKEFTSYSISEGNLNGEFKRWAHCQSETGEVFFGGVGGIVSFFPFKNQLSNSLLNLVFTDLYVYSERMEVTPEKESILKDHIDNTQTLIFDHSIKSFSIGFCAVEYNDPEKVIYQIKMDGFDNTWKTIPLGSRLATYTNLPSGKYTFRVRALLPGTEPLERSLLIVIHPPLWLTWWAITIYVLCIAGLGYYMYWQFRKREWKKKENMLRANEARIMQSKLQFFTDISHEIRTPLTLILAPVEQLAKGEDNPKVLSIYKLIIQNGQRILRLINQTMDMRRIDRGQVQLNTEVTDVQVFIRNISSSFEYISREKGVEFLLNINEDIPPMWLDQDIMDKVLVNVISNAFKYTPEGGRIELVACVQKNELSIEVSDTGVGIPKEQRKSVFSRFYRIQNDKNKTAGTGIGLHIALSLLEIHRGHIYIDDTDTGIGTRFVIRIPVNDPLLKPQADRQQEKEHSRSLSAQDSFLLLDKMELSVEKKIPNNRRKYKLLIVEDDKGIRKYLLEILREEYVILEAENGRIGLEMAMKEMPDCIISDLMMPEMDGLEMCRKIKTNEKICQIPVIILTAKTTMEDRIEGLQVGADSYIPKPFNVEHLKTRISKLIELRTLMTGKLRGKLEPEGQEEVKSYDDIFLKKLETIVRERIADSELTVETISREMGISRSHFQRKLKLLTTQNPSEYIKIARLRHAAWLLTAKKLTISEVTYATGFSSLSHFSNSFKEFYGMSPTKYTEVS